MYNKKRLAERLLIAYFLFSIHKRKEPVMEIGHKLKQLRVRQNLTLEELASRCELTKGFLSQVERNLTSPSIVTLNDILEALGSSLSEFFREEKQDQAVFHKEDFFVDKKEDYTIQWIVPNSQKNEMEPILMDIPGGSKSFDVAPHHGEEFGIVLEGSVILCIGNTKQAVRRGETFYLKGKEFHCIRNENKTTARILWISTPPIF